VRAVAQWSRGGAGRVRCVRVEASRTQHIQAVLSARQGSLRCQRETVRSVQTASSRTLCRSFANLAAWDSRGSVDTAMHANLGQSHWSTARHA